MLNIGDFAPLGGVSVRMLRHYDDLGLLRPVEVDAWTGRRHYEVTQLGDLNRLVAFKDLGFTLEQVGDLLRDGVEEVDARLRLIESEHGMYAGYVATRTPRTRRSSRCPDARSLQ